jgi:hypothetical protein
MAKSISSPVPQDFEAMANRARKSYDKMWAKFNRDADKSWNNACRNLRRALCKNASELVPTYTNMKDHMEMVFKVKEQMKNSENPVETENPAEVISDWLTGKLELSRIPLEGIKVTKQ